MRLEQCGVAARIGAEALEVDPEGPHDHWCVRGNLFVQLARGELTDGDQYVGVRRGVGDGSSEERDLGAFVPLGVGEEREIVDRHDGRRRRTMRASCSGAMRHTPTDFARRAATREVRFVEESRTGRALGTIEAMCVVGDQSCQRQRVVSTQ